MPFFCCQLSSGSKVVIGWSLAAFNEFGNMAKALDEKKIEVVTAELTRIPTTTMELSEEAANDVLKLVDKLEQDEDVQKVYHNLK